MSDDTAHGGNSIGGMVPDGWYTRSEAAGKVGRSVRTLRRWEVDPDEPVRPSGAMQVGKLIVGLYNDDDIEALKRKAEDTKPGRKPRKAVHQ